MGEVFECSGALEPFDTTDPQRVGMELAGARGRLSVVHAREERRPIRRLGTWADMRCSGTAGERDHHEGERGTHYGV
jgi:hypothetical protein